MLKLERQLSTALAILVPVCDPLKDVKLIWHTELTQLMNVCPVIAINAWHHLSVQKSIVSVMKLTWERCFCTAASFSARSSGISLYEIWWREGSITLGFKSATNCRKQGFSTTDMGRQQPATRFSTSDLVNLICCGCLCPSKVRSPLQKVSNDGCVAISTSKCVEYAANMCLWIRLKCLKIKKNIYLWIKCRLIN